MISSDKGSITIDGKANEILAEFIMLSQKIYSEVYKTVFKGDAKQKYFDHISLTVIEDEDEFTEATKKEFEVNDDNLVEKLQKLLEKLNNLENDL